MMNSFSRWFVFLFILISMIPSCGGDNNSKNNNTKTDIEYTGQALLGPLADALVEVYQYSSLDGTPIYTTTTTNATYLEDIGKFNIPSNLLEDNGLFLIKVTGGMDTDNNDDGNKDAVSTKNNGAIHALLTTDQIKNGDYHVSILTEVMYQLLRYKLAANYSREDIKSEINSRAEELLKSDMNGDGNIDRDDIASWDPYQGKVALRHGFDAYTHLISQIISGKDPAPDSLALGDYKISNVDVPGSATAVSVADGYAYVATYSEGLQIIDLSDQLNPRIVATVATQDRATDVYVKDGIAYVTVATDGLQIVDVSSPANPKLISSIDTPGCANSIIVRDGLAYIADHSNSGLQIINVSDPYNPFITGSFATPDQAFGVAVSGGYAYVTYFTGMQVIDINNPSHPTLAASMNTPGDAQKIVIKGNIAYIAAYMFGLEIVDISDPLHPVIISSTPDNSASNVAVDGERVYLSNENAGVSVVDVSDPLHPKAINKIYSPYANDIMVSDGIAYIADEVEGLVIVDIDHINPLSFTGTVSMSSLPSSIAVNDGLALITTLDYPCLLEIVDVQNPTFPIILSSLDIPGTAAKVAYNNEVAYVAAFSEGLQIVDISDPVNPFIVGSVDTPGSAVDVDIDGEIAYVTDFKSGLQIMNVADTENPTIIANVEPEIECAFNTTINNGLAYVSETTLEGLRYDSITVIDIDDPSNPVVLKGNGELNTNNSFTIAGNFAYAYDSQRQLKVIDLSDPVNPVVGSIIEKLGYSCAELAVADGFLYVADGFAGVKIYDLADPANPVRIGTVNTLGLASHIAIADGYIYVNDGPDLKIVKAIQRKIP
jgi:hypothetical protein